MVFGNTTKIGANKVWTEHQGGRFWDISSINCGWNTTTMTMECSKSEEILSIKHDVLYKYYMLKIS